MTETRFPHAPEAIGRLPVDARGYPVPWFVGWIGRPPKPDFRVIRPGGTAIAHNKGLCWICGGKIGRLKTFTVGPMCTVNRVSSEPPSHLVCARFAVQSCPFLTTPAAKRREAGMPPEHIGAPGIMLDHNPGVTALWSTLRYSLFPAEVGRPGALFNIGKPHAVEWWAEGRAATREEVVAGMSKGLPALSAEADKEGPEAREELDRMVVVAMLMLPAA